MTLRTWRDRLLQQEDLNFLLTNRIPRLAATRFMGWFSQIENPLICKASIAVWKLFTELDLSEAKPVRYKSLHDCFVRELKDGARPVDMDPAILTSPCDAIVGAMGTIGSDGQVFQAKGYPYTVQELFGHPERVAPYLGGQFITLRLTSSMYHHFHAPADLTVEHVTHIAGDTWNVNPIALKRVERLFCKNERAAVHVRLAHGGHPVALVPVAAILVACLRLKFLDLLLHTRYQGPDEFACAVPQTKGQDMGWFQHGSTIIVFVPPGFRLAVGIETGHTIRMGQPLMHLPEATGEESATE
ncbi:archaetidylserine decarboxylase [Ideonella sp.]|uniref:archaetidylserine decarboxylase n=1 Tax=Ideonella sp. TaxID=1929293 RepID=UPI003BB7CB64